MHSAPRLLLVTACLCCAAPGVARAAKVGAVDIRGLDEAMTLNVRTSLSLVDAIGKDIPGRRLGYLVREAEAETREALEPFGYYSPQIVVERSLRTSPDDSTPVTVTITVQPGDPVRVRGFHVAIEGPGGSDRYLREELAAFQPKPGAVFEHAVYEASKAHISRRLAERGYFDADFGSRKVEVTRAQHAADIDLVWTSGVRYDMGPIRFTQTPKQIIRPSLLDKLVYWDEGSYYHQGKLDRLRESLTKLDYFSRIDIEPLPEQATTLPDDSRRVPVDVTLVPAKRSIYTAGVSYGTDSGPGVRFGVERRYLNDRGHKALAQLDYAQKRKTLTLQYRIPAFAWLDGWYTASLQAADEQSDYIDSRRVELVASRSGEINRHLTAIAAVHALRERWAYEPVGGGQPAPLDYRYATFLFPSLHAEYVNADDKLFPRRALSLAGEVKGGLQKLGSDANFLQSYASAHWYRGIGADNRLIVRGELGHTFTNALVDMPPSLRFYAGGDNSIRGYAYREVGPRVETDAGLYSTGAKNLITGSAEFEHYFTAEWGGAAFVDTGSAFDDRPDWRTGVGVGLRWRSPVGPVRVDIAHGLDHPDDAFQIYLSIGTQL